ncbi:MAG: bifunctional [glutamate--ammonia ligase]-adenylyl-L-tyrosine phosphorylase/[glutamate--ammonia-ligase] adenylyltransferase [Planctomycetota bacterium]|nr:bifunctional [glutamate--ammonia ligase]-adenylyl-L-tyrosine phosphorylase/[glutamate--ammonia-ligase] adenylyltransferase [Planctomycetota bacterium]
MRSSEHPGSEHPRLPAPDPRASLESIEGGFRRAGFHDPTSQAAIWKRRWQELPSGSAFAAHWPETWQDLVSAADPDLALIGLIRWIEQDVDDDRGGEVGGRGSAWGGSREFRGGFIALSGISPALGELIRAHWQSFRPADWRTGWASERSLASRLEAAVEGAGERQFLEVVRSFKSVELLRIAYMDCLDDMPVDQVTWQVSTLADVLIARCFERARRETADRLGFVAPASGFSVLALGKLGGGELNYSSDVDLNFICDERLGRLERRSGAASTDPLEIQLFFTRLAERLISYATKFTAAGQLFRLDTRLRPDGGTGRLVWSSRASLDYYYTVGRIWERQALIRMRHTAGDGQLSARFREELESFVFPATLSEDEIGEMRDLKLQVERLAADRGEERSEIKIGQGGIRDVEYIVQYLQLVHGSRVEALRVPNVFEALEALEREGLLKAEETDVLGRGYRFLRRLEHRLQLANLLRTHRLPDDPRERLRLARGLGYPSDDALRSELAEHSARIRQVYRLLFEHATRKTSEREALPALLDLPLEVASGEAASLLAPYGFQKPERAFARLRALSAQDKSPVTKEIFRVLLFRLLREISRHPQPDHTLSNFEDCVRSVGARSVFFQLLAESDETLSLFVDLSARSNLLVEILKRNPGILDEVVDCMTTGYTFDRDELNRRVAELLAGAGDFEREIFNFKYTYLLLTAIRDLEGTAKVRVTMENVSQIAEAVLTGVLLRSRVEVEEKLGKWAGDAPDHVVLGLGKLGGQEMTYRSDVDLVLIYEGECRTERGIGSQEYFERFSQLILAGCQIRDTLGPLLHVDLRLRPLGSHNSLMISFEAWASYFAGGPAETWERQAFMRARPVAGSAELAERAMRFIRSFVLGGAAGPPDADTVRRDVWSMRQKIEAHARKGDLKRGRGGIMDVEFLVQALQLLHGAKHPEILVPSTALAIERLEQAGVLSSWESSDLFHSYQFLRWIENRLSLVTEPGEAFENMGTEQLKVAIQKIGYRSSGEESAVEIFSAELEYHRRRNRAALMWVVEATD